MLEHGKPPINCISEENLFFLTLSAINSFSGRWNNVHDTGMDWDFVWPDVCISWAFRLSHCEFMSAMSLSCLKNTVSMQRFIISGPCNPSSTSPMIILTNKTGRTWDIDYPFVPGNLMIMFSTYLLGMSSCVDHYLLHKKKLLG